MRWTITVIVVLVLAAGLWWLEQERQTDLHRSVEPPAPIDREEEPRYPLPRTEPETDRSTPPPPSAASDEAEPSAVDAEPAQPVTPLPPLTESDPRALEALSGLIGPEFVRQWIRPEFVIARTVALINSLDGPAPAMRIRPLRTLDAEPAAALPKDSDDRSWTAEDVRRYDELVATLDSVSPERAAATYARYYPLLQQAWEDLGEDEPHFNDRLIDIVDHLLAAPEVAIPFAVTAYEGRLIFAEDALESRSWGQKALIRLGPEHADRVKTWLREFRLALVGGDDASEAPIDDRR